MVFGLFTTNLSSVYASERIFQIELKNISNAVLTPPIVALCPKKMRLVQVGEPASNEIEELAEGGNTDPLASKFELSGCNHIQLTTAVGPGQTTSVELQGRPRDRLYIVAMLLPTNDAFIAGNGRHIRSLIHNGESRLRAYDAGTEFNDELCANIPGPQCGGEGFNEDREQNNFVKPHPGLQGVGDVDISVFNWGEPVARIKVK